MSSTSAVDLRMALEKEKARRAQAEATLSRMKMFLFDYFHRLGPDPMGNIDIIVQTVGKALGSTVALYNRLENNVLTTWSIDQEPPGYIHEDNPEGHICYNMTIMQRSPDNLSPVVLEDLENTEWKDLDSNVSKYNLKSYLAYPVQLEDRVVGSLCVVDVSAREYTPIEIDILEAFAKAITLEEERRLFQVKLAQANEALVRKNAEIENTARTDYLTGLPNRRAFQETLATATAACKRRQCERRRQRREADRTEVFTIVLCDIDHFKQINDTYGHNCGDYVLTKVGTIIRSLLRGQDSVARWGGEEFILMLPETDLNGGQIISERIRQRIEKNVFKFETKEFTITMTFGLSVYDNEKVDIETCIGKADSALYKGKNKGRNQVVLFQ